jgi:hypothetical protein
MIVHLDKPGESHWLSKPKRVLRVIVGKAGSYVCASVTGPGISGS